MVKAQLAQAKFAGAEFAIKLNMLKWKCDTVQVVKVKAEPKCATTKSTKANCVQAQSAQAK